ncbi:MAG: hypothetical protein ACK5ZG_01960 [Phycisphaerae bacterium]|jgi:hypothetical protein
MRPPDQRLVTRRWFAAACVVVLLKLLLCSHAETLYAAWDSAGYVESAGKWHWGAPYEMYSYIRVPTFNLYLASINALGVPVRLANELVLALAALLVAQAVWACGLTRVTAWLSFALLTLHPWTYYIFNLVTPDGLYATLLVAFIAAMVLLVRDLRYWQLASEQPRLGLRSVWRVACLAAPTCGLAALVGTWRQESALLLVPCGVAALAVFWHRDATLPARKRSILAAAAVVAIAPYASVVALKHVYSAINARVISLYAPADFLAPGYAKLHQALLSIPPAASDESPKLQAPTDVRMRAYNISPTFALLKPWLEGESLQQYAPLVRDVSPDTDEYGAWLVWGIRDAAFRYRSWPDAGELDRFFAQAAEEIRVAQHEGRLARRFAPLSFVAPAWRGLLRELPESASQSWIVSTDPVHLRKHATGDVSLYTRLVFDRVALRRTGLDQPDAGKPAQDAKRDVLWHSDEVGKALRSIWRSWAQVHAGLLAWAWWLPLVVLGGWCWHGWRTRRVPLVAVLLGCTVLTALARFALVCLLDASGVWTQPRYLLAFSMLSDIAIVLAFASVVRQSIDWIKR